MNEPGLRKYPVSIDKDAQGRFEARLIDLPGGPKGVGASDKEALKQLTDRVLPTLNQLAARGEPLHPSDVADRPYIAISPMIAIQPLPPETNQPSSQMLNYGWTQDKPRGNA